MHLKAQLWRMPVVLLVSQINCHLPETAESPRNQSLDNNIQAQIGKKAPQFGATPTYLQQIDLYLAELKTLRDCSILPNCTLCNIDSIKGDVIARKIAWARRVIRLAKRIKTNKRHCANVGYVHLKLKHTGFQIPASRDSGTFDGSWTVKVCTAVVHSSCSCCFLLTHHLPIPTPVFSDSLFAFTKHPKDTDLLSKKRGLCHDISKPRRATVVF